MPIWGLAQRLPWLTKSNGDTSESNKANTLLVTVRSGFGWLQQAKKVGFQSWLIGKAVVDSIFIASLIDFTLIVSFLRVFQNNFFQFCDSFLKFFALLTMFVHFHRRKH